MSIISNLLSRFGYIKAPPKYPDWALRDANVEQWTINTATLPDTYGHQATLYQKLSWIAGAVDMVANSCAAQNVLVKKITGEEREDIKNHPFEKLLFKPNPLQSRYEFIAETVSYYAINGNSYWWINAANETSEPAEIWCIPNNQIRPVPDGKLFLRGYIYDPGDGSELALEPWEICHFKRFNPFSRFVGMSKIESIYMQANGDLDRIAWDQKLYREENGRLPGILAFADDIADHEWDKLLKEARSKSNKREMMMLRGSGMGGVQWIQTSMSNNDMQFIEQRTFTKEEIYSLFAPGLASMLAVNATEANSIAGEATFAKYTLWPILDMMAQKVTKDILPRYGDNLLSEFEDPRVKDRALEMQEMAEYAKTHTIEEVRKKYYQDKPLGDDRDKLFVSQIKQDSGIEKPEPEPQTARLQQEIPARHRPDVEAGQEDDDQTDTATAKQPNYAEAVRELAKWRRRELRRIKTPNYKVTPFETEALSPALQGAIEGQLETAKTEDDVKRIFSVAWRGYP